MTKRVYRWRKTEPPQVNRQPPENSFSAVPEDLASWTPWTYFKLFCDDEITQMIAEQTNLYSVEKSGVQKQILRRRVTY